MPGNPVNIINTPKHGIEEIVGFRFESVFWVAMGSIHFVRSDVCQ